MNLNEMVEEKREMFVGGVKMLESRFQDRQKQSATLDE